MDSLEEIFEQITQEEARVLGCLLEKEATTPDTYPLTLNSLLLACNQKTNRNPVVDYDEDELADAIEGLRSKKLAVRVDGAGSRVPKFRHLVDDQIGLNRAGKALLTVLLLRGPQTLGELRLRTERMYSFATTELVETELKELAEEVDRPLWVKLPQAAGQKEERYAHLLSGEIEEMPLSDSPAPVAHSAMDAARARSEKITTLEEELSALKSELAQLKAEFAEFRQQFD